MDFQKTIKQRINAKYAEILDDKGKNPYRKTPNIQSYELFSTKQSNYHERLKREKATYNYSLQDIQRKRKKRLELEEKARQEREARRQERKEQIIEIVERLIHFIPIVLFLLPIALLLLWANQMRTAPLVAFAHLHFGWVIAIYVVAFFVYVLMGCYCFKNQKPFKGVLTILGSLSFLVLMIVGMLNMPDTLSISTTAEFEAITNVPGAGKRNYELVADIDFEGKPSKCWGQIDIFTGTFDGNNHAIKNLTIESESRALEEVYSVFISESGTSNESRDVNGFGFVQNNKGVIENIRFDQIDIVTTQGNNQFIGIIAAYNAGKINNCLVTNCTITATNESDGLCYVGGIVGYDDKLGEISNVAFINTEDDVVFDIKGERCYLGGIAGESYAANIKNVYAYQRDKNLDRFGGIIGVAEALNDVYGSNDIPAYLTNCVNCFAPTTIYAYGESVPPLVIESNIFTFNTAITDLSVLPEEMRNWTYLSDFGYYSPCSGFE